MEYTRQSLSEFKLAHLRVIAASYGVVSPTSKRKDELIADILAVISGEKSPVLKGKRGRPPLKSGWDSEAASSYDFGSFTLTHLAQSPSFPTETASEKPFFDLPVAYPDKRFSLWNDSCPGDIRCRIIDAAIPLGRGQRGFIAGEGKTSLLKNIAAGVLQNSPEVYIIYAIIGGRPEEISELKNMFGKSCDFFAAPFNFPPEMQIAAAAEAVTAAKRAAAFRNKDVLVLLDDLTALLRAYTAGQVTPANLTEPKRLLAAARKIENGGSVTILAALGLESEFDRAVYEELKPAVNYELILASGKIDIEKSRSLKIEKFLTREELAAVSAAAAMPKDELMRILTSCADYPSAGKKILGVAADKKK